MTKILVTGDTHGNPGYINAIINKQFPDIVIQCGDNAYFWLGKQQTPGIYKPNKAKIYMLPGNHEDWRMIESIVGRRGPDPVEVEPNVFYCPIGSTIEVNGKRIMFIGGAESIDKAYRVLGRDYFEEELLTQADIDYCLSTPYKIDVICSHTCPYDVRMFDRIDFAVKKHDPTMGALNIIGFELKPSLWFFGHWHRYLQGKLDDIRWWALAEVPNSRGERWWMNMILSGV